MSNLEKVIGWYGGAAEPRVITIWDEERIFMAAQFIKVFHNKTLNPYVIKKFLNEFKDTDGYGIEY